MRAATQLPLWNLSALPRTEPRANRNFFSTREAAFAGGGPGSLLVQWPLWGLRPLRERNQGPTEISSLREKQHSLEEVQDPSWFSGPCGAYGPCASGTRGQQKFLLYERSSIRWTRSRIPPGSVAPLWLTAPARAEPGANRNFFSTREAAFAGGGPGSLLVQWPLWGLRPLPRNGTTDHGECSLGREPEPKEAMRRRRG